MTDENGSALKGLAAYRARKQEQERAQAERSRPKIQKFALEKDGDSAIVRFGQEIDADAKNYSEKAKIGFVNIEHVNPEKSNGWKNRANCTVNSQGACYPDDLVSDQSVSWDDRKGWKQKEKFYVNVIGGTPREVTEKVNGKDRVKTFATDIDEKTGDGTVYLLEQGTFNGIYDALADMAGDDETITENYYKIRRKGNLYNDTSYIITKGKVIPKGAKDLDEFELIDFEEEVLNEIPYGQQEAYYWRDVPRANTVRESAEDAEAQPAWAGAGAGGTTKTGSSDGW